MLHYSYFQYVGLNNICYWNEYYLFLFTSSTWPLEDFKLHLWLVLHIYWTVSL